MTLPFDEKVVNNCEYSKYNFEHPNFIGYLNKYGEVLDYSNPLGIGGHNDNKLTTYFEYYFRMPTNDPWIQQFEDKNVINLEIEQWYARNRRTTFKEKIEHSADLAKKYGTTKDPYTKFQNDLDIFFYNCYQSDTFMDGFGQNCMSLNKPEFYYFFCKNRKIYEKGDDETEEQYNERHKRFFNYDYHWYLKYLMLDWYKTVTVQYMKYHLIERCKKGITTCDSRPNETFFNYLLNDYTIHQISPMIYDDKRKMHIEYKQNPFLVPDSELRLKEEIQAIKKLVPLNERSKYYR